MKKLISTVFFLISGSVSVHAANVYSGCASPPTTFGHIWYVDPVHGKTPAAGGAGSQASPWDSLVGIVGGQWGTVGFSVPGYTRPLLSTVPYFHTIPGGRGTTVADNLGSPPVQPGDAIMLMSGNYGNIVIGEFDQETANSSFVTIQAAPGQAPVFSTLYIESTTDWVFNGIKVQSLLTSANANALIMVTDQGGSFPTSNIVFENMLVSSQDNAEAWSQAQWIANARNGIFVNSSAGGEDTQCTSVTGSHISNVRNGVIITANRFVFSNNQIDHFGDDGIDYGASNLAITKNNIHDNLNLNDGNHEDAMQGIIGVLGSGSALNHFQNILIDSNLVIRQTDPGLAFPTGMQGIDAFDSDWTNLTVTNNVVITSACWGIAYSSIHNSLIANNTVLADHLVATPGCAGANVSVGDKSNEGPSSSYTVVRNNLTNQINVATFDVGVEADHNVAICCIAPEFLWYADGVPQFIGSPGTYANGNVIDSGGTASEFVNFNPATLTYNIMLRAGAPAIGAGTAAGAPTIDLLGATRTTPYTAGAYSYPY